MNYSRTLPGLPSIGWSIVDNFDGPLTVEQWHDGIAPQINVRRTTGRQFSLWLSVAEARALRDALDAQIEAAK